MMTIGHGTKMGIGVESNTLLTVCECTLEFDQILHSMIESTLYIPNEMSEETKSHLL